MRIYLTSQQYEALIEEFGRRKNVEEAACEWMKKDKVRTPQRSSLCVCVGTFV